MRYVLLTLSFYSFVAFADGAAYIGRMNISLNHSRPSLTGFFTKYEKFHEQQWMERDLRQNAERRLKDNHLLTSMNSIYLEVRINTHSMGDTWGEIRSQNIHTSGELESIVISTRESAVTPTPVSAWELVIRDGEGLEIDLNGRDFPGLQSLPFSNIKIYRINGEAVLMLDPHIMTAINQQIAMHMVPAQRERFTVSLLALDSQGEPLNLGMTLDHDQSNLFLGKEKAAPRSRYEKFCEDYLKI